VEDAKSDRVPSFVLRRNLHGQESKFAWARVERKSLSGGSF